MTGDGPAKPDLVCYCFAPLRALISGWPSEGHYTPLVSLASALQRAGHEVLFATGDPLAEKIRRDGFEVGTVGLSV